MKTLLWMFLAATLIACDSRQDGDKGGQTEKAPDPSVLLDPALPVWKEKAPDEFKVKFTTSKGDFVIQVERAWSPNGADRFYTLAKNGYYDGIRFFRVVPNFMAQFGIHGNPKVNEVWSERKIPADPVVKSNERGWVTYAMRGGQPDSRTTQIFINFGNNKGLDGQGFSPFGKVVEGMEIVDKLYNGYGDGPPRGRGPDQGRLQKEGNEYLNKNFKDMDYIKTARLVSKDAPKEPAKEPPKEPPKDK